MCFYTTKTARTKIAKEDIKCWKVLADGNASYCQMRQQKHFQYYTGQITDSVILKKNRSSDFYDGYIINEGYHSFKTSDIADLDIAVNIKYGIETGEKHRFIIPKGAYYFSNKSEYVSSTIMLIE